MAKKAKKILAEALGMEEASAMILYSHAFRSPEEIVGATNEQLMQIPGMSMNRVQELKTAAQAYVDKKSAESAEGGGAAIPAPTGAPGQEVPLVSVKGVGPKTQELLAAAGITAPSQVAQLTPDELSEKTGIPLAKAQQLVETCRASLSAVA
jgi:predicted flap endonuclease-1-like 5' DNA nuclease